MKKILVLFGVLLLLVGCTGTPVPATPTDTPVFEPSAIPSAVAKDKVEPMDSVCERCRANGFPRG